MAVTKISDIINPQVMGDIINAKIEAQCKLTPYAKVDTRLQGVAGDTITVPSWNYIGDAVDFDPEVASNTDAEMEVSKLTAGSTTFTVKCAGKSVGILQTAINSGMGDPVGQANIQLAKSVTNKIDADLIECAYTCENVYDGSASEIGYTGIVGAVCGFEDEEDGVEKVMFIHPEQEASLLTDEQFISADKFTAGVAVNGAIGKVANCEVVVSKKVPLNAGSTGYVCPIVKLNESADTEDDTPAMTIYMKRNVNVETERISLARKTAISVDELYTVALSNASKVVLATFKK